MKLERRFTIEEHEEYGTLGFRPVDMPHADPLQGMAAVHDVLEHFPNDDGGIEAELMALGAMFRVRGEEFFHATCHHTNTDPSEHCAADFREFRMHYECEGFSLIAPGGQEGMKPVDDEHVEEWINRAVRIANRNERDEGDGDFWIDEKAHRAKRWLRIGYARACDRFEGTSTAELALLFERAMNQLDRILHVADERKIGGELILSFNLDTRTFRVDEPEWHEDY